MHLIPPGRIVDARAHLHELDGATLRWWVLGVSLGEFRLVASGFPEGVADVRLLDTWYIDCPVTMHSVRLRVATAEEVEVLRLRLPLGFPCSPLPGDQLIIDCEEGAGVIWAQVMEARWVREPDAGLLEERSGPLWPGGPPLADL